MFRLLGYAATAWLLLALVGGLADTLDLSVALPAPGAVLVAHAAFAATGGLASGLGVAAVVGYLEDVHQGAPAGVGVTAHMVAFFVLTALARRVATTRRLARLAVVAICVAVVDLVSVGLLAAFADPFEVHRPALLEGVRSLRWHALVTVLAAEPVWALADRVMRWLRVGAPREERVMTVGR
jgi:cell shape-determining protein MreD